MHYRVEQGFTLKEGAGLSHKYETRVQMYESYVNNYFCAIITVVKGFIVLLPRVFENLKMRKIAAASKLFLPYEF